MLDKKTARSNILYHTIDNGLYTAGIVCFNQVTIMVAFVKKLYDSPLIIGLIPALLLVGFNFPGLITTHLAQRYKIRKKFVIIFTFLQRVFLLFMALSVFLFLPIGPIFTMVFVLIFYFGFAFSGGISAPAWLDFNAKTIPIKYRARTQSYRMVIAGIGGIFLPVLIHYFLTTFEFPFNYQLCFFTGFALTAVSYIFFMLIKETDESPVLPDKPFKDYLISLWKIIQNDKNYVRYLIAQACLSVSECGPAFFTYYAIKYLNIGDETVVIYMFLLNISMVFLGLLLGHIGDKFGNLRVIQIGAFVSFIVLLLVIFWPTHIVFYIAFFLSGISISAKRNSFLVLILEFGNDENRIRYSALTATLTTSLFGIMPFIGGIILSNGIIDFRGLFVIAAVFSIIALILFLFTVKIHR
jgi:MFS family permease